MKYLLICIFVTYVRCFPRVEIENGKLIGTNQTLSNGRVVYAFLGVPFAAPPIKRLRFEAPRPAKRWFGYRNAKESREFCIQFFYASKRTELQGVEDCLYINIHTPRLPKDGDGSTRLMNVLFYVYGGGFSFGGNTRTLPDYLLQNEDIVFVCSNYRVGPFGFFSSGDEVSPGNNGMKDVVEALRWVQKNIRQFGGDPTKVTVYGISAGAAIVHYLLLSPLSKGLFHNAVSASGTALAAWALPKTKRIENSMALASLVNCPTFNNRLMMMCLRRKPAEKLYDASLRFYMGKLISDLPFAPVLEPKIEGAVVSEHPYDSLINGQVYDVPWIVGVIEREGSVTGIDILYNETKRIELNNKWNDVAPNVFLYDHLDSNRQRDHISSSVRQYYFGDKAVSDHTARVLLKAIGDRIFYTGIIKSTKLHRSAISKNVFCYKFYYRGTASSCDMHPNPIKKNYGSCHGDDQLYLFSRYNPSKIDLDMVELSTSTLIAFMKTGNPNTPDVEWPPLSTNGTTNCLNIYSYTHQRMVDIEESDVTKFWDEILPPEY